jgi:NhaP-type Na+/H+ or K+/H+ antiporter
MGLPGQKRQHTGGRHPGLVTDPGGLILLEYQRLAVLAGFAFLFSVFASRLEQTPVSGALVYLVAGLACGSYGIGLVELYVDMEGVKGLAEFTLAVVLFSDAANADIGALKRVR